MKGINSLREKFMALSKLHKAQIIMASLLTLFLLIAVPTYAWFSISSKIETLTKIKAPTTLDIKAGHATSIQYLDLSDIIVTSDANGKGHKDYIFAVKAGNSSAYDIQLAYTTNIPFTYQIFRARELEDGTSGYVASFDYTGGGNSNGITFYYDYASNSSATLTPVNSEDDAELELVHLNADTTNSSYYGRTIAESENGTDGIYSNYTRYSTNVDVPEIYAVPLYSRCTNVTTWNPDGDYFILRISWDTTLGNSAFAAWNAAANNKETDIIYISAKVSASH